ncbi:MAG: glycosyltransferase family 4 protein [Acidobacteria bacterium]|nr:glycosyltransferase family 4 protein [Acidobacteriota bacterium]
MKILLINQCFYPDVVSSAQHLTDLAVELSKCGHSVTVLTGRRGYDNPGICFPKKEIWKGISIIRIPSTGMGKKSRSARAIDFGSFMLFSFARMLLLPRHDAVVALTSPPLISSLAAIFAYFRRERFYCWIMDLNPDEAIAAGWLREKSIAAKILSALLRYSTRTARKLIVLDRFMKDRLLAKGIPESKIAVIPPWSHDPQISYSREGRAAFRSAHGLTDKFVVMYSGNHSPCHPLDTLLQAASRLADRPDIRFLFIGGGSEFGKAQAFAVQLALKNADFLPYQPLDRLSDALSSADLHVAVMGNPFTGIVHPCKIYNILTIGSPFLYIGPEKSHIEDMIRQMGDFSSIYSARHGDVNSVADSILDAQNRADPGPHETLQKLGGMYSRARLLPHLIETIECTPETVEKADIKWELSKIETSRIIR